MLKGYNFNGEKVIKSLDFCYKRYYNVIVNSNKYY